MNNFKVELEERLIGFAAQVLKTTEEFPDALKRSDLGMQILYSATAPAFAYAEAQSADTPKEFLNKLKDCRNSLRQMHISLRIMKHLREQQVDMIDPVIEECGHLIALFAKSVKTKKANMANGKQKAEAV